MKNFILAFSILIFSSVGKTGGGGSAGWSSFNNLQVLLKKAGVHCTYEGHDVISSSLLSYICRDDQQSFKIHAFTDYYNSDEHLVDLRVLGLALKTLGQFYMKDGYSCSQGDNALQCKKSFVKVTLTPASVNEIKIQQSLDFSLN